MLITRHTVLNKYIVKYIKILSYIFKLDTRKMFEYLVNKVEAYEYEIEIKSTTKEVIVKYKAERFSLEDLFNSTKKVYGNGKPIIIDAYRNNRLAYIYSKGYNTYIFTDIKSDTEFNKIYTMKGNIDINGTAIIMDSAKLINRRWCFNTWWELYNEVLSNIIYYTNIKYKRENILKLLLGVTIYGFQKDKNT